VTSRAPAKINVYLRVLGLGADGYHSIETLFLRLGLADELAIEQAPGLQLEVSGDYECPPGPGNIAWRAADAFFAESGRTPEASIRLIKRIPVAAGLGGGSSDAASVLTSLNKLYDHPLDDDRMMKLAAQLGSDVPFFVADVPYAFASGRGDRVRPLAPPPSRAVLIVVPDFGVSARDAYAWRRLAIESGDQSRTEPGQLPVSGELGDWGVIDGIAGNDLAEAVLLRCPKLRVAASELAGTGPSLTTLCGSGSCLAGVYRSTEARDRAATELAGSPALGAGWRLISTWTDGPGAPDGPG
jgi:4-diphosphocytidyl-2-C-methyl-D-erythritol kinase